jgi:hypothetical protein
VVVVARGHDEVGWLVVSELWMLVFISRFL